MLKNNIRRSRNPKGMFKACVIALTFALLMTVTTENTLAYLFDGPYEVENVFEPTAVPNTVVESFDGAVKSQVKIRNDGNTEAYIRAVVVVNWQDNTIADTVLYGEVPKAGIDYQITWTKEGWIQGADGYFYYQYPVSPGETTEELFTGCKAVAGKAPRGHVLSVQILGQSVQAKGGSIVKGQFVPAVTQAWGTEVNADGSLTIRTRQGGAG